MKVSFFPVVPLSAAFALCFGCVAPVRASNHSFAPKDWASARFPGTEPEALDWLSGMFKAGGFRSRIEYGDAPNKVYVFQGTRGEVAGQVYWGRKGRAPVMGSTVRIGSIFYAYFKPAEDGATFITLYGKPTVAGHELCERDDTYWKLPCEDLEAAKDWEGRRELTGATEAQAVQRLWIALSARRAPAVASAAVPTLLPPSTLAGPPRAGGCNQSRSGSHLQPAGCSEIGKTLVYADDPSNPAAVSGREESQNFGRRRAY